jgi:hypothetical protein
MILSLYNLKCSGDDFLSNEFDFERLSFEVVS